MTTNHENEYYQELGKRLSEFREILGLARQQLAKEVETPASTIANYERGEIKDDLFFLFINRLIRDFGINFNWIISGGGQAFIRRGPKTTMKVYENYYKGYYSPEDGKLLSDLIYLIQIPEGRESLKGHVMTMKYAFKELIDAFKAAQKTAAEKISEKTAV